MKRSPDKVNDLKLNFETSLTNLKQWYDINGLQINPGKTECIVITYRHNNSEIDSRFKIIFDGHEIIPVTVVKSLGVLIDNNLNFDERTHKLCSKRNRTISQINRKNIY